MKGFYLDSRLEKGQHIALRFAIGVEEKEFLGVVRSFDLDQGLISLEVDGQTAEKTHFVPGQMATIVGKTPGLDLDIPCVMTVQSQFPILTCREVDRRNHLRVNAFLHVEYRRVDRALYEADQEGFLVRIKEEMSRGANLFVGFEDEPDAEGLSPKVLYILENMSRKLDRILSLLEKDRDGESMGVIPVNISGSGIRFAARDKIKAKGLLAIRVVLPLSPPVSAVFLAEARRVRETANGLFETAAEFVAIEEADRERIVRYAFKRMRESIRSQKKKTDPM
jgi:c-di-GMP-binding flagellar brake protein YcgR